MRPPVVNYRNLRFKNINTDEYRHVKLLLFWPAYLLMFFFTERVCPERQYYPMYCGLDDLIPFCEFFIIPYVFWYLFLALTVLYTLAYDTDGFRRFMKYIIITFSAATLIHFILPTCQNLRPTQFERENIFTEAVSFLYRIDTNTNVCPSVHVIGSVAVMSAALRSKMLESVAWKTVIVITGLLICAATVLLKQHSVIDIIAALPICLVAEFLCYGKKNKT